MSILDRLKGWAQRDRAFAEKMEAEAKETPASFADVPAPHPPLIDPTAEDPTVDASGKAAGAEGRQEAETSASPLVPAPQGRSRAPKETAEEAETAEGAPPSPAEAPVVVAPPTATATAPIAEPLSASVAPKTEAEARQTLVPPPSRPPLFEAEDPAASEDRAEDGPTVRGAFAPEPVPTSAPSGAVDPALRRGVALAAMSRAPLSARPAPTPSVAPPAPAPEPKPEPELETPETGADTGAETDAPAYNFAYLDENTKRMVRRALMQAVAIPGYQVPFASREMPMPYGWGTGGVQVTAACLTPDDVLKVIDQGADDTTNAVSIRQFFEKTADVETTTRTEDATIIQTRHRVPETPLTDGQILVYQVPIPEPLRFLEPRETETRKMHALEEYGLMHVKLYEDIARHGRVATAYAYPVKVAERYVMDPSPIPKFDNPKLSNSPALQLFGAGREQRIYALPPYTKVVSLDFEDHPFERGGAAAVCALCGAVDSYLDEIIMDDAGTRSFICSDTDYCEKRRAARAAGLDPDAVRNDLGADEKAQR